MNSVGNTISSVTAAREHRGRPSHSHCVRAPIPSVYTRLLRNTPVLYFLSGSQNKQVEKNRWRQRLDWFRVKIELKPILPYIRLHSSRLRYQPRRSTTRLFHFICNLSNAEHDPLSISPAHHNRYDNFLELISSQSLLYILYLLSTNFIFCWRYSINKLRKKRPYLFLDLF